MYLDIINKLLFLVDNTMYKISKIAAKKRSLRILSVKKWACETTLLKCLDFPNKDPSETIENSMIEFALFASKSKCARNKEICYESIEALEELEKEYEKLN